MVEASAIVAVVLAAIAVVVTVALHISTRIAQNKDRQRIEDLDARSRQEQRLQALKDRCTSDTQSAMETLETVKAQHQGETLWTALQQDPAVRTGPLLSERQARNEVKGFWEEVVSAMAQGELPPAFGGARLDHIRFSDSRWLERSNNFRELVEPFDIANYYRMGLDRGSAHYPSGRNRPDTYAQLQDVWLRHLRGRNPVPMTFTSSVVRARAMEGVRDAPEAPAAAGTPVKPLQPVVLPPGTLPLGHEDL